MALQLSRGETILYPMPYVEAERPPYVVTNQRLIERSERGERVLQVKQLLAANRAKSRPYAAWGTALLCLALGVAGSGAYFYISVFGMEAAPYKALLPTSNESEEPEAGDSKTQAAPPEPIPTPSELPDDPSAEHPDDAAWRLQILKTRLLGMGLMALAAAIGMLGLKIFRKKRFFVVCRTQDGIMRIQVPGKVQQDIILATLQAVK
jgi:hypothetical protein